MLKRILPLICSAVMLNLAMPAFADGKPGAGPSYTAPAPLQSHAATGQIHYSGLATNPRPNCHHGCQHQTVTHQPVCGQVTTHCGTTRCCGETRIHYGEPRIISSHVDSISSHAVTLDSATIASMNGGVGTGVNDVFVGGGGGVFNGGGFGATGARTVFIQRGFVGGRTGFKGGSRRGFRGGRRGGGRRGK